MKYSIKYQNKHKVSNKCILTDIAWYRELKPIIKYYKKYIAMHTTMF